MRRLDHIDMRDRVRAALPKQVGITTQQLSKRLRSSDGRIWEILNQLRATGAAECLDDGYERRWVAR